jgi:hypothetical protein
MIGSLRKWVGKVGLSSFVDDVVMVTPDLLQPVGLSAILLLLSHEGGEALVVSVDRGRGPLQVATPFPKSGDQCK